MPIGAPLFNTNNMKKCKKCKHWKPTVNIYKGGCRKMANLMKYTVEYTTPISILTPITDHNGTCDQWQAR